jgi:hypothetical protein
MNLYPFASKLKFIEIDLHKNEYLLIPSRWVHWVITEPATIGLSFEIMKYQGSEDNIIYNSIKNNKPYKGRGINSTFNFTNFVNENKETKFRILFSQTDDCSPVIKNDKYKYFKNETIDRAFIEVQKKKSYAYAGGIITDSGDYPLENYIDKGKNLLMDYYSQLWFTLDKKIQSGMHWDSDNKFLLVLQGKKKVLLLPPEDIPNIDTQPYHQVSGISSCDGEFCDNN